MPNESKPSPRSPGPAAPGGLVWPILLLGMMLSIFYFNNGGATAGGGRADEITYSEFLDKVKQDQVHSVVLYERRLVGTLKDAKAKDPKAGPKFAANRPNSELETTLPSLLEAHGVKWESKPVSPWASLLYMVLLTAALMVVFMVVMRRANPAERAMAFGQSRARRYVEKDTKTTFADVAGIEEPKQELEEIVEYLRTPEKFRRLGGRIPKGVLLVGVPGTGKTLLAKAVAGEAKVPFFSMSGSDFVELFVGVGASRVRDLFKQAQQQSPCIVFIDELDALGKARGQAMMGGGHDEREQTLNQLLVEMDGFDSGSNVIIMAATNRPEILDPALLRPGRFDRQVMIPPPDIAGREAILKVHSRHVKMDPAVNLREVAARTSGFVGADLANVVNEAALLAARRERELVVFEDFDEAIDRVSIGIERRSHVMSDDEKRITAYHEAGHALVAVFCQHADQVHKISIIPRGFLGGFTQFLAGDDRRLGKRAEYLDFLAVGLGGRAAEELALGEITSGAAGDIKQVTALAWSMVVELGMSDELGPVHYEHASNRRQDGFLLPSSASPVSEATAQKIDAEVRRLVDEAHERATAILSEHRDHLEALAQRLLEVEVVTREEMDSLLGTVPPTVA